MNKIKEYNLETIVSISIIDFVDESDRFKYNEKKLGWWKDDRLKGWYFRDWFCIGYEYIGEILNVKNYTLVDGVPKRNPRVYIDYSDKSRSSYNFKTYDEALKFYKSIKEKSGKTFIK